MPAIPPHILPGWGSQTTVVHPPPSGAQMPQLSLQQNSPGPHRLRPHRSPFGGQTSCVQASPSGTHRLQLSLQQYSPGPQVASLQGSHLHSFFEHRTSSGMQMPPHFGQHFVP
jgi:hypothetical protein